MKGVTKDLNTLDLAGVFRALGLYRKEDGAKTGKHHVDCPWQHEHSMDGGLKEASIWQNGAGWPQFHCFHGHCDGRGIEAVIDWAESQQPGVVDAHCSTGWLQEHSDRRPLPTRPSRQIAAPKIKLINVVASSKPLPTTLARVGWYQFLLKLYKLEDFIEICWASKEIEKDGKKTRPIDIRKNIHTVDDWEFHSEATEGHADRPLLVKGDKFGVWFCINPLLDQTACGNGAVADHRFTLIEGDGDSLETQFATLVSSGLPIAAIYSSGGRSIHALIRVDAGDDAKLFAERVEKIYASVSHIDWIDKGRKAAGQLSRLPGAMRGDKKQELLSGSVGPISYNAWERIQPKQAENEPADRDPEVTQEQLDREYSDTDQEPFPAPMADAAFHGPLGKIALAIASQSEASREALMTQILIAFGSMIGRGPFVFAGEREHFCNEFLALVGDTYLGRKGTSTAAVRRLFKHLDLFWSKSCQLKGIQSGEGIIHAIRDPKSREPRTKKEREEYGEKPILEDKGIEDKRLLITEEEFAQVLSVAGRKDNTAAIVLRELWDSPDHLQNAAKNAKEISSSPHGSLIAHITREELRQKTVGTTDAANGFLNRFMFVASKKTRTLAEPRVIDWDRDEERLLDPIKAAMDSLSRDARDGQYRVLRDEAAGKRWKAYYEERDKEHNQKGVFGKILARSAPHVVRLSLMYAIGDNSDTIRIEHQIAAESVVDYCERSAKWIFGVLTGNRLADRVIRALRRAGEKGISRTDITNRVLGKNYCAAVVTEILTEVRKEDYGLAKPVTVNNHKTEIWYAKEYAK